MWQPFVVGKSKRGQALMEDGKFIFRDLRLYFNTWWIGLLAMIVVASLGFTGICYAIFFLLVIDGFLYFYKLGALAKCLGKSPIVWVGLTMITSPIGTVVAYFLMKKEAKEKLWI